MIADKSIELGRGVFGDPVAACRICGKMIENRRTQFGAGPREWTHLGNVSNLARQNHEPSPATRSEMESMLS